SEPVHVSAPPIERSDERADNLAVVLCDEYRIRIVLEERAQPSSVIGRTGVGIGVAPEREECIALAGRSRSDQDLRGSAMHPAHNSRSEWRGSRGAASACRHI